jgi:transposase-like protein
MAVVADIVELLRRWDVWRRVEQAPDRIDALEKRIAELESRLQRAPGEACPSCGEFGFRIAKSQVARGPFADMGARNYHWKCQSCGYEDVKMGTDRR